MTRSIRTVAVWLGLWVASTVTQSAFHSAFAQYDPSEDLLQGYRSLRDWRMKEARLTAERLLEKAPDDPVVQAFVGAVKMHHGDYAGAIHMLDRAERAGVASHFLADRVVAASAREATEGYAEAVGEHFLIRYVPGKDEILIPYAFETLNAARARIGELLGFVPDERVVVELYPSAKTLSRVSSLTAQDIENSGTIALCRWNRLMVTTPRAVVFGYAWRDTLAHELTHLIIGGASHNTVPIWLHEGISKFAETAWRSEPGLGISVEQQESLRKAARKNKLIPFAKMHPSMAKLPTQEQTALAFAEVFTFIEFLVDLKGWEGIRALLTEMAAGLSDAEAIRKVYGKSLNRLERAWKKSARNRKIRKPGGLRAVKGAQKIELKQEPEAPDDALHGLSKEGRRFARAADLLFARGRYRAAQKELEKAYAATRSPLISGKLAMVALATGDLTAAETAAEQALEGAPQLAGPNVTLAEIRIRAQKPDAAEEPLARAIDINPFDPRIHRLTLELLRDQDDEARAERATRALHLLTSRRTPDRPHLGSGGLIQIEGPPFHRVFVRPEGASDFVPTGLTTPTPPVALAPGRYELKRVPPEGKAILTPLEVVENPSETPQLITPDSTPSSAF